MSLEAQEFTGKEAAWSCVSYICIVQGSCWEQAPGPPSFFLMHSDLMLWLQEVGSWSWDSCVSLLLSRVDSRGNQSLKPKHGASLSDDTCSSARLRLPSGTRRDSV